MLWVSRWPAIQAARPQLAATTMIQSSTTPRLTPRLRSSHKEGIIAATAIRSPRNRAPAIRVICKVDTFDRLKYLGDLARQVIRLLRQGGSSSVFSITERRSLP